MRVLRTVTGRRALHLALLVGGLLALGFLCGGRAQAAEGTPSSTPVVTQEAPPHELLTPHRATPPRKPVTGSVPVVPVAVVPVVDGVGDVVRTVTGSVASTLTQTLGDTLQQVSELPTRLPTLPVTLPATPVVQVPEPPVVSGSPGSSLPAPVTSVPRPVEPRQPVTHAAGHEKSRPSAVAAVAGAVSYGPRYGVVPAAAEQVTHHAGHRAARAGGAPERPAPTGDPDGVLGKSAVDGTAFRHGDMYAVTFVDRAPLRLVPGAVARVDAAGTPDRYRDIPVFPG
ncbi:hypothetical protein AB0958_26845 [Streptomyces sp. NPDC006655]|uniref:hypothetical protein n=1 Tax=Streptomyces sp. NPDC006655 TaxID=3156898 RepID=UPI0034549106